MQKLANGFSKVKFDYFLTPSMHRPKFGEYRLMVMWG